MKKADHAPTDKTNATTTPPTPKMTPSDSLNWWSSWSDILAVTGVILGAIVATVAIVGWVFSWKAGKLKDEAFESFKLESILAVSVAEEKAAEANSNAAKANERAAILEKEAAAARLETEKIKKKLAETAQIAAPPVLIFDRAIKNTEVNDLCATVILKASKNEGLGVLRFVVTIIDGSSQNIVNLWPSLKVGAFQSGKDSLRIEPDGKLASLQYSPMSAMAAGFDVTLSGPARIQIRGNRITEAIELQIA